MLALDILFALAKLSVGIAVFLMAVKIFSGTLKAHFVSKMRPVFVKMGKNRFAALGLGAGATAVMQSSTATTVLTVGLVNAGILTLFQATAIIMGANVGTTLTTLLVSLSSLQIKYIFMAVCFAGLAVRISANSPKQKIIGNLLTGFGGIFIGLEFLNMAFIGSHFLQDIFISLFSRVTFPLLLILLGAVFTAIIQSSGASIVIYMTMLSSGILSFNSAIFLLFGSEIGTCLTTLIASAKGNTNAKRAALVHLLFNIISAILFTAVFWPLGGFIIPWYTNMVTTPMWQLSIFQVMYNLLTVVVLIWFVRPLNALVVRLLKEKPPAAGGLKQLPSL